MRLPLALTFIAVTSLAVTSVPAAAQTRPYTRADTLRGSFTTPGRAWWDVTFYDLHVTVDPSDSTIRGRNTITYFVPGAAPGTRRGALVRARPGTPRDSSIRDEPAPRPELQIDLMAPLDIDSVVQEGRRLEVRREGNAFFASPAVPQARGGYYSVAVYYHGRPQIAKRPPWEGGFSWKADSLGRPWVVTTDQGMGASVWWPNKDTQADEPDSQRIAITVPKPLVNVSNGRLRRVAENADGTTTYEWFVVNPINNYAIAVAAGSYAHWSELYQGERGTLTLDFWPLDYNLEASRRQWTQARSTLACFEHWFGPYPFYEDGYKLIEVSNNGMEHQSAVAYGNGYANGYRGRDGSGTGLGMQWDFIIVHETAHEWWGNNLTTNDLADMWVHESFANYAENLYTECLSGKEDGARYVIGTRRLIGNEQPIVPGAYGVNAEGSGDMYPKGGNMLHTIRQLVGDDEKWRGILRGLNQEFRHSIVTGERVQRYISAQAGIDLSKVFEQYLTRTDIPLLEYRTTGGALEFRWARVVAGFDMPVEVTLPGGTLATLRPTSEWQRLELERPGELSIDPDYYIEARMME
jgi:aminopeptidase N